MAEIVEELHPDRSEWPAGPWDGEPDREDFVHAGFACFVQRNRLGAWCGYVGVPSDHPAYGLGYDEIEPHPNVHGGLTYAAKCSGHLCHIPPPGMPTDVWWLGFDTAHGCDTVPGMMRYGAPFGDESYKTLAYVKAEARHLAEQLGLVR